jgi:hypothetical protein
MMIFDQLSVIANADWSKDPGKRWMAIAVLMPDHHWFANKLEKVVDPLSIFTTLKTLQEQDKCILTGFDFPLGVPMCYAEQAKITDFLQLLSMLGHGEWEQFYNPALTPGEISLHRPFYPAKPGSSKRIHLERGLGLSFNQLYRLCEVSHKNRRAACPLFWTMGGQQVGKAAIAGWRDLLSPALADHDLNLRLWPFSGTLIELCRPGNLVVAETYPAEFYGQLGLTFSSAGRKSKRRRSDRLSFSEQLISWPSTHRLELSPSLKNRIVDGFGSGRDEEDQFDALVGLYGMINIVTGCHDVWEPRLPQLCEIEGWIFGQSRPEGAIKRIRNQC